MTRTKDILYSVARDASGNLVLAVEAEKTNHFHCDQCGGEMIVRKSLKEGKGSKRPHFAHKTLTPNCTPESALHFTFKNLLFDFIEQRIREAQSYHFTWRCEYCHEVHGGDLLKKAKAVKLEHNLKVCQPDIALLNVAGAVYAVIEVVVSHKPEESVLQYYNEKGIVLIQIDLKSESELFEYPKKINQPDRVTLCVNPKCKTCGAFKKKRKLWVIESPCWKCKEMMKVAVLDTALGSCGPESFNELELKLARKHGVIIQKQYSRTAEMKYFSSTCKKCNAFAGIWYLGRDFLLPAKNGQHSSIIEDTGFDCIECELKSMSNTVEDLYGDIDEDL